jgi:flagellin
MSLSIRTNISSLNAQRNLYATQQTLDSSLARLSSGYRITKAGDDAAGLGISTKLESQIRSYSQATRNANDGISVVQASEAALNEQSNILTRLRELAMQSASDGVGTSERGYIDTEAQQLLGEIQRIAQVTEYNGTKLLDGSNVSGLDFHVGIANTRNDVISLKTLNATTAAAPGTQGRIAAGTGYAGALVATGNPQAGFDAAWPAAAAAGAGGQGAIA